MAVGLEVKNSTNNLVIDGTYSNLGFKQTGSVDCNQATSDLQPWYYRDIVLETSGSPVLAIRNTNGAPAMVKSAQISGSQVTFRIFRLNSGVVEWVYYDTPHLSSAGYGLQVFNPSGQLVFDSSHTYMKVIDIIAGNGAPPSPHDYPGRSIAVVQGSQRQDSSLQSLDGGMTYTLILQSTAMTVSASSLILSAPHQWVVRMTVPSPLYIWTQNAYSYLVLDVTGI